MADDINRACVSGNDNNAEKEMIILRSFQEFLNLCETMFKLPSINLPNIFNPFNDREYSCYRHGATFT
jgi:hypothetical protein